MHTTGYGVYPWCVGSTVHAYNMWTTMSLNCIFYKTFEQHCVVTLFCYMSLYVLSCVHFNPAVKSRVNFGGVGGPSSTSAPEIILIPANILENTTGQLAPLLILPIFLKNCFYPAVECQ